jgi:CBS-domain-containing membrane protein
MTHSIQKPPARPSAKAIAIATLGSILAIAILSLATNVLDIALLLGSFGASTMLLFAYPALPFSQPRNVVGGHLIGALVGLVFLTFFGDQWWLMSLAVGVTVATMMLTGTVHPPAGANPIIVFFIQPDWMFLLYPITIGAVSLVMLAWAYHRVIKQRYPIYW